MSRTQYIKKNDKWFFINLISGTAAYSTLFSILLRIVLRQSILHLLTGLGIEIAALMLSGMVLANNCKKMYIETLIRKNR